ncbi:hypothetical protein WICPIJ_004669 [Wickerhamomyces pijperi]|uniref:Putative 5'-nucleotidase C-terminal domain-containing protein n=1 Tax=Wickerhamomyces pijperi TaxID=599730 RepID=A0A9P8Q763_WICPI|nr:hypothetical protein WICPIJ_004669 [Wickerhamomyces pijperi]
MITSLLTLLTLTTCTEVVLQQQPHITPPKHSSFRELIWGDINYLHTTDTHGWYAGHLNQKPYSADWGDFISLTQHFKTHARVHNVDLLIVDTGDKHDGNGLSDATVPNGLISTGIFNSVDYDLVTIGNHELYYEDYSRLEYEVTVEHFGERYVSSNVEYLLDNDTFVSFGNKFRYFTTENQQRRVLALSFLFNFQRYNDKTRVTPISEVLQQSWFIELTKTYNEDNVDTLVVFGHIPVTDHENHELESLHVVLRRWFPDTLIQYLGGHSHIRDFTVFDNKATGLQSGRYCETVGFVSLNFTTNEFNRRYIDFNLESFKHHAGTNISPHSDNFDTKEGLNVSSYITKVRKDLNLAESYGYVPVNYLMNGYPLSHKQNLYTFLSTNILPTLPQLHANVDRVMLINSGGIRYDLYKGNYTRDSEFIVSPFTNDWNYIRLPRGLALRIAPYLNKGDFIALASPDSDRLKKRDTLSREFDSLDIESSLTRKCTFEHNPNFKKGQTTTDDHGCEGDDVKHNNIAYFPSPNVVQSYQTFSKPTTSEDDLVDVVFYSFIQSYVMNALNDLDPTNTYKNKDFLYYGAESTGQLLTRYVKENWA